MKTTWDELMRYAPEKEYPLPALERGEQERILNKTMKKLEKTKKRPARPVRTALLVLMGAGMFIAIVFYGNVFSMSSLSFAAWLVLVALALLVVPIQMGLEKLFDRCSVILARRAEYKARRRAARAARSRR